MAIIQLFQRVFSENPPLRSTAQQQQQARQQAAPPPLPPRPQGTTSPTIQGTSPPQTPVSPTRPPPPPPPPPPPRPPPTLLNQPQLHPDANGLSSSSSSSSLDQLVRSPPPIPYKSPPPLPPQPFRNHTPPPIPYRGALPPTSPFKQQFDRPRASSLTTHTSPAPASVSPPPDILDTSLPPPQSSVLPAPPLPPNPEHARLVKHLNHLIQAHIQPSIQKTREQQTEARQEREKLLNVEVQAEKEIAEVNR